MQPNDDTNIDRNNQTVLIIVTKTTESESRDLGRQLKIKLNRYDREKILTATSNRESPQKYRCDRKRGHDRFKQKSKIAGTIIKFFTVLSEIKR